jgi:hypothetical protein
MRGGRVVMEDGTDVRCAQRPWNGSVPRQLHKARARPFALLDGSRAVAAWL